MKNKKIRTFINNQKQYKIFQSKQLIGILVIILFSFLFVVACMDITGFTTIHSYTFGMLFGYYSYIIYLTGIYWGLTLLFNLDILIERFLVKRINRTIHFSWFIFILGVVGFALVLESSISIYKSKDIFLGVNSFSSFFNFWWDSFTKSVSAALPNTMNSGIIVSFLMSLISSVAGSIVSIIIGLLLLSYFVYFVMFGSIVKNIKSSNKQKKHKKEQQKTHSEKVLDLSFEDINSLDETHENNQRAIDSTLSIDVNADDFFPIENPFETSKVDLQNNDPTIEIAPTQNTSSTLKIEKQQNIKQKDSFELDIFDSHTEQIDLDSISDIKTPKKHNDEYK